MTEPRDAAVGPVLPPPSPGPPVHLSPLRAAFRALRVISLTASVIPVALGAVLSIGAPDTRWAYFPLVLVAAMLLQAGTNVVNDVVDYRRGVDTLETMGDSGVFVGGHMSVRAGHVYGLSLFAAASAIGVVVALLRGWPVLVFGGIGVLGGYFYTGGPKGYKYLALGDVAVFLLMGPVMVMGTFYALTGDAFDGAVILASLPIGFLVTAILEANNLRDLETDRKARVRTVATLIGFKAARLEYVLSVAAAYVVVAALVIARTLNLGALAVVVTLPVSASLVRLVMSAPRPGSRRLSVALPQTALLHMAFGFALVAGVGVGEAF